LERTAKSTNKGKLYVIYMKNNREEVIKRMEKCIDNLESYEKPRLHLEDDASDQESRTYESQYTFTTKWEPSENSSWLAAAKRNLPKEVTTSQQTGSNSSNITEITAIKSELDQLKAQMDESKANKNSFIKEFLMQQQQQEEFRNYQRQQEATMKQMIESLSAKVQECVSLTAAAGFTQKQELIEKTQVNQKKKVRINELEDLQPGNKRRNDPSNEYRPTTVTRIIKSSSTEEIANRREEIQKECKKNIQEIIKKEVERRLREEQAKDKTNELPSWLNQLGTGPADET